MQLDFHIWRLQNIRKNTNRAESRIQSPKGTSNNNNSCDLPLLDTNNPTEEQGNFTENQWNILDNS